LIEGEDNDENGDGDVAVPLRDEESFRKRAAEVYDRYRAELLKRFKWMRPSLFIASLETDLTNDARALIRVLKACGSWDPEKDAKLDALHALLARKYPDDKVLVFTQFADTVNYLAGQVLDDLSQLRVGVDGVFPNLISKGREVHFIIGFF
jgi:hypothetical protein